MTQPALSRRIAALERDAGIKLFSRAHRQIELTTAGEAFARAVVPLLADAAIAERVLRVSADQNRPQVRVCARTISRFALIPASIRAFRTAHPNVAVSVVESPWGLQFENLRKGVFDVTVVRGPVNLGAGLQSEQLRSDPIVVALPQGHRLGSKSVVSVGDLSEEPFVEVVAFRTLGYRDLMRGVCARAGFIPNVVQEVGTLDLFVLSVASGLGVGLIHDVSRELATAGVVYRPLHPKQPPLPLYAVWRATDSGPAIEAFVGCLKQAASYEAWPPQRKPSSFVATAAATAP
jgi:DNA-binding transcriptional LysR family regulator